MNMKTSQSGFTLVEIAIVLLIVTIMVILRWLRTSGVVMIIVRRIALVTTDQDKYRQSDWHQLA